MRSRIRLGVVLLAAVFGCEAPIGEFRQKAFQPEVFAKPTKTPTAFSNGRFENGRFENGTFDQAGSFPTGPNNLIPGAGGGTNTAFATRVPTVGGGTSGGGASPSPPVHYFPGEAFPAVNGTLPPILPSTTLLAGNGKQGDKNGAGVLAELGGACDVAVDKAGNLYLADTFNNKIKKLTPSGQVSDYAGTGIAGLENGQRDKAMFDAPFGLAMGSDETLYVADSWNHAIRSISSSGNVETVAGGVQYGHVDGVGASARFMWPMHVAVDRNGVLFVTDFGNHAIRRIADREVKTVAGDGQQGERDGTPTQARFSHPMGLAILDSGELAIADSGNNVIRAMSTTLVRTLAGGFDSPRGLARDNQGNLLVGDYGHNMISRVTPEGVVSIVAGMQQPGFSDDPVRFRGPHGLAMAPDGTIYVADTGNHSIRKISP